MASVIVTQEQAFLAAAAGLGVSLTDAQVDGLRTYHRELADWSRRVNLTALTEYPDVLTRHFLDSLTVLPVLRRHGARRIVDVGTGAGFPGLPLAIACPDIEVTLIDSVGKKTAFCEHVAARLRLTNASVLTERAENLGQNPRHRAQYDAAVSRAVDRLATLAEYLLPLSRVGGLAVVMKKGDLGQELAEANKAIVELGGEPAEVLSVTAPELQDGRVLIVIQKRSETPVRYPRRAGMPRKRPL